MSVLSDCNQSHVVQCIDNAVESARYMAVLAAETHMAPHVLMRPKISIDGNHWCALYGENLQDGVCGFGKSPKEAMESFDMAWTRTLQPSLPGYDVPTEAERNA